VPVATRLHCNLLFAAVHNEHHHNGETHVSSFLEAAPPCSNTSSRWVKFHCYTMQQTSPTLVELGSTSLSTEVLNERGLGKGYHSMRQVFVSPPLSEGAQQLQKLKGVPGLIAAARHLAPLGHGGR